MCNALYKCYIRWTKNTSRTQNNIFSVKRKSDYELYIWIYNPSSFSLLEYQFQVLFAVTQF